MTRQIPFSDTSINKTINHEQLNQIIEAILAGKYSWACFLLLRSTGYDPLHYIPYRTYNRLVKENCTSHNRYAEFSANNLSKITDLDYLEAEHKHTGVRGGDASQNQDLNSAKFDSLFHKLQSLFNYK